MNEWLIIKLTVVCCRDALIIISHTEKKKFSKLLVFFYYSFSTFLNQSDVLTERKTEKYANSITLVRTLQFKLNILDVVITYPKIFLKCLQYSEDNNKQTVDHVYYYNRFWIQLLNFNWKCSFVSVRNGANVRQQKRIPSLERIALEELGFSETSFNL